MDESIAVVVSSDEEEEDCCTEMFFQRYYTLDGKCRYHCVCLPRFRALQDPELLQLIRKYGGTYQSRLKVKGKKGWLIPNENFEGWLSAFKAREGAKKKHCAKKRRTKKKHDHTINNH